ncbi:MAG: hypothetical protein AB8H86_30180 [Polyangiales bacterium]
MKILGLAFACLSLAGCSIIASSGDYEIPVDGGPDTGLDGAFADTQSDADVASQDGNTGMDVGPAPDCSDNEECNATNASAICGFEGTCVIESCFDGFADCDMAFNNGCEINTNESIDHCGRCGEVCDFEQADESCVNGTCEFEGCQEGFGDCNGNPPFDGCEVRLNTAAACGSCEVQCRFPTSLCDVQDDGSAICVPNCEDGEMECNGGCVDFATDPSNCGACLAPVCPAPPRAMATCEMSSCSYACEEGRGDCNLMQGDGCEVDTTTTVEHCGMCEMACEGMNALWTCAESACVVDQCDPIDQFSNCDGDDSTGCEVDILNDSMNCGGCGVICDGPCVDGFCDPIEEVTGQDEHICVRRSSGTMFCWGTNLNGQLGDGTFTARPLPAMVLDPATMSEAFLVREISVGQSNTCAIDMDGDIWCWGSSAGGATGAPEIPTTRPRRLFGDATFNARTFTQIAGGQRSNCAVDDEQHVWCWGSNSGSQLGTGVAGGSEPLPARVADVDLSPLDEPVAQLVYGSGHGCVRLVDGSVRCWGLNDRGQVGTGAVGNENHAEDVGLSGIVDIAAGDNHTCAVSAAGNMWCWGINDNGQFGNGTAMGSLAPQVIAVGVVSDISAGLEHTCASVDGEPRCWGRGDDGELGTGTLVDSRVPATPAGVSAEALLTAVHNYTCAFGEDGLDCWGSNARGQLGRDATIVRTAPTPVTGLSMATEISVERTHSCAVSDGDVYCWGQDPDGFGRLGGAPIGATPGNIRSATSVRTAINGTSITTTTGTAFGFGFNSGGRIQFGTGPRLAPSAMTFSGNVDEVGMGTTFACALQGSVVNCRGLDDNGQLGRGVIGGGVDDGPAQPVVGLSASQLSVGPSYVCALRSDDQVVCWGDNNGGQLGDAGLLDSPTPLAIAPLDDAIMVTAGYRHACAIQRSAGGASSGQVWCWGRNAERQSGGAVPTTSVTPNMVSGLSDAIHVQAYTSHSCAIRSGGQAVCWGNNQNYELGDGTTDESATPVDVVGLNDAVALGSGGIDAPATCAVRADGSASCWGGCWDGICGTGEDLALPTAAPVQGLEL